MSCVLRAAGANFDVEAFLRESAWTPCRVFIKGKAKAITPHKINAHSGFNLDVSDADFRDLSGQIADAIAFLEANDFEIQRLQNSRGLENIELDFAIQSDRFSSRLLLLCGQLNIDLVTTQYA